MHQIKNNIGLALCEWFDSQGIQKRFVADKFRIPRSSFSYMMKGRMEIPKEKLGKIIEFYRVPTEILGFQEDGGLLNRS